MLEPRITRCLDVGVCQLLKKNWKKPLLKKKKEFERKNPQKENS